MTIIIFLKCWLTFVLKLNGLKVSGLSITIVAPISKCT